MFGERFALARRAVCFPAPAIGAVLAVFAVFCVAYAFVVEQVLGDATMEVSTWPRAFVTLGLAGAVHVPTLSHLIEAAPVVAPLLVAGVRHP